MRSIAPAQKNHKMTQQAQQNVEIIKSYIHAVHNPNIEMCTVMGSFVCQISIPHTQGSFFVAPFFREGQPSLYQFYHNKDYAIPMDKLQQMVLQNAIKQSPSGMVGDIQPMGYTAKQMEEYDIPLSYMLYLILNNHIQFNLSDKTYL